MRKRNTIAIWFFALIFVIGLNGAVYRNKATRAVWSGELLKYVAAGDTFQTTRYLSDTCFVLLSDTGGIAPITVNKYKHLLIGTLDTTIIPLATRNINIMGNGYFRLWLNDTLETPYMLGGNNVNLSIDVRYTVRRIILVGMDTSDVYITASTPKILEN